MTRMAHDLVHPPKARPGEQIAVISPSFAAAGAFPEVHEQAMRRLTGYRPLPVEYRRLARSVPPRGACRRHQRRLRRSRDPRHPRGRRRGGSDHCHPAAGCQPRPADPKPFLGRATTPTCTTGSGRRHHEFLRRILPGPPRPRTGRRRHPRALAAGGPVTGETLEITDPGESEDVGLDWGDPRA